MYKTSDKISPLIIFLKINKAGAGCFISLHFYNGKFSSNEGPKFKLKISYSI